MCELTKEIRQVCPRPHPVLAHMIHRSAFGSNLLESCVIAGIRITEQTPVANMFVGQAWVLGARVAVAVQVLPG